MSVFPLALVRRPLPPDQGSPVRRPAVWPWLLMASVVVVVDVVVAAVLFAMGFPVAAVVSLIGGASGVALTTVGYLHQLLGKSTDVPPSPPGGLK